MLLDDPKKIGKKIKSAVTDSETVVRFDPVNKPGVSNLLTMLSVLTDRSIPDLEKHYEGSMYGPLKTDVADAVVSLRPVTRPELTSSWKIRRNYAA